jgi:hypothetical protein
MHDAADRIEGIVAAENLFGLRPLDEAHLLEKCKRNGENREDFFDEDRNCNLGST